jgi:hypothetical protein
VIQACRMVACMLYVTDAIELEHRLIALE